MKNEEKPNPGFAHSMGLPRVPEQWALKRSRVRDRASQGQISCVSILVEANRIGVEGEALSLSKQVKEDNHQTKLCVFSKVSETTVLTPTLCRTSASHQERGKLFQRLWKHTRLAAPQGLAPIIRSA